MDNSPFVLVFPCSVRLPSFGSGSWHSSLICQTTPSHIFTDQPNRLSTAPFGHALKCGRFPDLVRRRLQVWKNKMSANVALHIDRCFSCQPPEKEKKFRKMSEWAQVRIQLENLHSSEPDKLLLCSSSGNVFNSGCSLECHVWKQLLLDVRWRKPLLSQIFLLPWPSTCSQPACVSACSQRH